MVCPTNLWKHLCVLVGFCYFKMPDRSYLSVGGGEKIDFHSSSWGLQSKAGRSHELTADEASTMHVDGESQRNQIVERKQQSPAWLLWPTFLQKLRPKVRPPPTWASSMELISGHCSWLKSPPLIYQPLTTNIKLWSLDFYVGFNLYSNHDSLIFFCCSCWVDWVMQHAQHDGLSALRIKLLPSPVMISLREIQFLLMLICRYQSIVLGNGSFLLGKDSTQVKFRLAMGKIFVNLKSG